MPNYLSKNIAFLRKEKGWTQGQLAKQLGLSVSQISGYETGNTSPQVSGLEKLVQLFNVSYDDLIGKDLKKQESSGLPIVEDSAQGAEMYEAISKLTRRMDGLEKQLLEKAASDPEEAEKVNRQLREIRDTLIAKYPDIARELGLM